MKSDQFELKELVDFSEGNIHFHGRRLVLHSINAFAQFRKDLIEMVGLDHARRILTRFGYFWGEADAAALKRILKWDSLKELILAWPKLLSLEGAVKTRVKSFQLDEAALSFEMEVTWHHSAEAEEHLLAVGESPLPICWILTGYASGFVSFALGKNVYFLEETCMAAGNRICTATGKDEASWGPGMKHKLSYFQSEDIRGTILNLTRELRNRTRELERRKKEEGNVSPLPADDFMEIRSLSFQRVLELARRVAPYDSSVLITGESGVGKEILARYIQKNSPRFKLPFLTINCAALPQTLLESELFGHKAGAFTGAIHDRLGLFEQSDGGTLFLDEIGDITPELQVKLLRWCSQAILSVSGRVKPVKSTSGFFQPPTGIWKTGSKTVYSVKICTIVCG
jgi:two-component system, NtrC family, response regulator HydG